MELVDRYEKARQDSKERKELLQNIGKQKTQLEKLDREKGEQKLVLEEGERKVKELKEELVKLGVHEGTVRAYLAKDAQSLKPFLGRYAKELVKSGVHWVLKSSGESPKPPPEPPIQDEVEVDRQAEIHARLMEEIKEIEYHRQSLLQIQMDVEVEKTALDGLNRLTMAKSLETQETKEAVENRETVLHQEKEEAKKLEKANQDMSGSAKNSGEYVSFLASLANLLGMVPKKMLPNANEGAGKARMVQEGVKKFEEGKDTANVVADGVKRDVAHKEELLKGSAEKLRSTEGRLINIRGQQVAMEAELMQGKSSLVEALKLAEQKKREKEQEMEQAHQDYLAAKRRLLAWALEHEAWRKAEEQRTEEP